MDTDLVLRILAQAVSNQTINDQLILHTDQCTQYISKSYQKRLTRLDIQHFFRRKGCPCDLKKELVYQCQSIPPLR